MDNGSDNPVQTLTVVVGGRNFRIGCEPEEQDNLQKAAAMLNSEITSLQNETSTLRVSLESSAVLAALNFAAELLRRQPERSNQHSGDPQLEPKIATLIEKIDSVLTD